MRAPVYRNLDSRSTFLGLVFPTEWMAVLGAGWLGTALGAPNVGAGAGLAIYLVIRIAHRVRAPALGAVSRASVHPRRR